MTRLFDRVCAGPPSWIGALVCVLWGCNARIDFTASPRHICPGQQVRLTWRVVGSATVAAEPPLPELPAGHVPSAGEVVITPQTSTRVELHATRPLGHPTSSVKDIEVTGAAPTVEALTASLADDGAAPGCSDGRVWATVHPEHFSKDIAVATVQEHPGDRRTYVVRHADVQATVGPGIVATEFSALPILGDWILTSPLEPGEACGTPALPRSLVVDVLTKCAGEER